MTHSTQLRAIQLASIAVIGASGVAIVPLTPEPDRWLAWIAFGVSLVLCGVLVGVVRWIRATRVPPSRRDKAQPRAPRPIRRFYQDDPDGHPAEVWAASWTLEMADAIEKTIARGAPAACVGGYYRETHIEFLLRPQPGTRINALKMQAEPLSRALGRYVRVAQSGTHVVVQVER
jgi:hypothetical protein